METTRQQKIARLIQRDISEILMKEHAELVRGAMVSVTKVRVTPDLAVARIFISVFPFEKSESVMENLIHRVSQIRKALGNRVREQLRIVPELDFRIDDSLEYIDRIDQLLK